MHNFVHDMLHNSSAARRIESLWREYEDGQSPEAKFVKVMLSIPSLFASLFTLLLTSSQDLDRFEMASQALEYERNHGAKDLQCFYDNSIPNVRHPQVQQWSQDLMVEREEFKEK